MKNYPFKKMLIALDLSEKDETTIQYASHLAEVSATEQVHFIYVVKSSDLPEDIKKTHINEKTQNTLLTALHEIVAKNFSYKDAETAFHVLKGSPLHRVLERAHQCRVDLIIAGKGNRASSSAVFPEKLARKAHCSVMVVPQGSSSEVNKILVPIDYSDYSKSALQVAIDLSNDLGQKELTLLRAYPLPIPYTITGMGWSHEKFCRDVSESAEKRLNDFIEPFDFKSIPHHSIFPVDASAGHAIYNSIHKRHFDLCIMGAKGKQALTAFFLGSTAEEVIRSSTIPVLIVKNKDENSHDLETMLKDWLN